MWIDSFLGLNGRSTYIFGLINHLFYDPHINLNISKPFLHSLFAIITFALFKLNTDILFYSRRVGPHKFEMTVLVNIRASQNFLAFFPKFEKFFGIFWLPKVILCTFPHPKSSFIEFFLLSVIRILYDCHSEIALDIWKFFESGLTKE